MWDQFDENTGCPLVALKKSCKDMRYKRGCARYIQIPVEDRHGAISAVGVCSDFATAALLWETGSGIRKVQGAVESARNRQIEGIAGLGNILLGAGSKDRPQLMIPSGEDRGND